MRLTAALGAHAAVALGVVGTGLLAGANALGYYGSTSINDLVTESPGKVGWIWAAQFSLPVVAGLATVAAAFAGARAAARGALVAVGVGAYLIDLQELGRVLMISPTQLSAGVFVGIAGAGFAICSGAAVGRGEEDAAHRLGIVRVVAWAGVLAALAGVVVPWATSEFGSFALLYEPSETGQAAADRWLALAPAGLAVSAGVALATTRSLGHRTAGGVLLVSGMLVALLYSAYGIASDTVDGIGLRPGGYLGFAGGAAIALAGAALIAVARPRAVAEEATPPIGAHAHATATRYLCAAAHLDERLARDAIRRVVDEEHRAVAPSYGVDVGTTLRHCFAARSRKRLRDVFLCALVVPGLLLLAHSSSLESLGYFVLLLVVAWAVVFGESWVSRYRVVARTLSRGAYDPQRAPRPTASQERRIAAVEAAEHGNVTVYSGFRPFVGSGWDHGGWSFALNIAKGAKSLGQGERATPRPFDVDELYDAIARDIVALDLRGVTVEDRLYVDGQGIRDDARFVPERLTRPLSEVDDDAIAALVHQPELANRVYRCIRFVGWDGEFLLSTFLNFALVGRSLFAEVRYFLLAPFKDEYLAVDSMDPQPTFVQRVKLALTSLLWTPVVIVRAPFHMLAETRDAWRRWRSRRRTQKAIRSNPSFDFGATTSIRELAQSSKYRRYFQQLDREMAGKIIERQILDTIVQFLDEHGIDTGELEERQTAILNNGVLVSGGTLQAESLAVGQGARARVTRVVKGDKSTGANVTEGAR